MKKVAKKFLIINVLCIILLFFFTTAASYSELTKQMLVLQPSETALLVFGKERLKIETSNPDIIKVESIPSLFQESKVTVKALDIGTANLFIKTKDTTYHYIIKVREKAPESRYFLLDTPY